MPVIEIVKIAFFSLIVFTAPAFAAAPSMEDIQKEYIAKCGGQSYSDCDGEEGQDGLNQETLFQVAETLAISQQKLILVVFGADWCPPCRMISRDLAKNPTLKARIQKYYIHVNLNGGLDSGIRVSGRLKINIAVLPTIAVYDPVKRAVIDKFFGLEKGSTEEMVEYLEQFASSRTSGASSSFSRVRPELLESPIKSIGNFGKSNFQPSTKLTGQQKDEFVRYMRQGILYFHSFYWINAIRSFNSALKLEKDNPVAMAFKALATLEEEGVTSFTVLQIASEAGLIAESASWLDNDDKKFVLFAREAVAQKSPELCKAGAAKSDSYDLDLYDLAAELDFEKADYLAIVGFKGGQIDKIEKALEKEPDHGGARHYLTHHYEGSGEMEKAGYHAEYYAKVAPDSPHAQHMWGHILPQLGRWEEASKVFLEAHKLHLAEFKKEKIKKTEDWHYPHNLDLLVSTLIYLDKVDMAENLLKGECTGPDTLETCLVQTNLYIATGQSAAAEAIMDKAFKLYSNLPMLVGIRILTALQRRDIKRAKALVEDLKMTGDWNSQSLVKAAFDLVTQENADESTILAEVEDILGMPGFDSWSYGVSQSRALIKVLEANGRDDIAQKIKAMAISTYEKSVCKTELCRQ